MVGFVGEPFERTVRDNRKVLLPESIATILEVDSGLVRALQSIHGLACFSDSGYRNQFRGLLDQPPLVGMAENRKIFPVTHRLTMGSERLMVLPDSYEEGQRVNIVPRGDYFFIYYPTE